MSRSNPIIFTVGPDQAQRGLFVVDPLDEDEPQGPAVVGCAAGSQSRECAALLATAYRASKGALRLGELARESGVILCNDRMQTYGRFELFDEQHPSIFGYTVTSDQDAKNARRYLVVMNWSDSDCKGYPLPDSVKSSKLQLLMGNYETQDSTQTGSVDLGGWEARLYLVD